MEKELKDQRTTVMLTESELRAVDDWSHAHKIRSRGEAIRTLLKAGLEFPKLADEALHLITVEATVKQPELHKMGRRLQIALKKFYASTDENDDAQTAGSFAVGTSITLEPNLDALLDVMNEYLDNSVDAKARARDATSLLLSRQENNIRAMLQDGRSQEEISKKLGISQKTAALYTYNIMRKLGVEDVADFKKTKIE